jgi:hypothetical protein
MDLRTALPQFGKRLKRAGSYSLHLGKQGGFSRK